MRTDRWRGIGPLAYTTRAQTFPGLALVGDACGYVDPVTGEGVFYALRGAELLAESLTRALEAGRQDRASLMSYRRARTREFAPRRALALTLQRGLRHPALVRAGLARLEAHPRWMDLLIAVAGDYVPLRELARPSVWWHFFGPRGAAIRA
jgi:flavin-dependent dehydrogenase